MSEEGIDLQKSVIGGMLMYNEVLEYCLSIGLTDRAFEPKSACVYREAVKLFSAGKEVNGIALRDVCDRAHMLDCMDELSGPGISTTAANELLRKYRMQSIISNAEQFSVMAKNWKDDPEALLGKAADIFTLEEGLTIDDPMLEAERLVNYWEEVPEHEREGLHWFLPCLERSIGPITNELIILEAARSVGKTAFSLQMAAYSARMNKRVSFVSLESMKESIAGRLITVVTGENSLAMKRGNLYKSSYEKARQELRAFPKHNIGWSFNTRTIESILAWAKGEKRKGSCAIFIDNMRHIHGERGRSKTEEFGDMSKGLKRIRDNVGIPVIVLHHLNREGNTGWSQDIENDADMVIKLTNQKYINGEWSEEKQDVGDDIMDVRLNVSKHRDGRCGQTQLRFIKPKQRFEEADDDDIPKDA